MVEMTIESIRVSLMNYQRVVILKEKESDRYLPIWIGPAEADAIAVRVQVPIYADESVLEKAGVRLDQEGALESVTGELVDEPKEVSPEELEKLSPFRDLIEGLDLEDFGKKS